MTSQSQKKEKEEKRLFLEIDKKGFIDWRYSDEDDKQQLFNCVKSILSKEGKIDITLNDLYNDCGYIPSWIIENPEVIPEDRKTYIDTDEDDFEFEPDETDVIHWI